MKILFISFILISSFPFASHAQKDSWAGDWETTFGPMSLRQSGSKVSGTYVMEGTPCKIEGSASGKKFHFTYVEPKATGEGWFEINGDHFSGQWKPRGSSSWSAWIGNRPLEKTLAGVWDTSMGRMRLMQKKEGTFHGIYSLEGGSTIQGKLKNGRFEFDYRETKESGKGWFELVPGGATFKGKYLPHGQSEWKDWQGTRLAAIPGRVWLVVIESAWQMSYDPREYAFGDMLKSFFDRTRNVEVRRRPLTNDSGIKRWLEELAYLPEPIVLTIAGHGESDGPKGNDGIITAKTLADSLQFAGSLKAVHFSSCLVMKGSYGKDLHRMLGDYGISIPVSGYRNSVDWSVSALFEMNYFDLILSRGLPPKEAVKAALVMFPAAGTTPLKNVPIPPGGFEAIF